MVHFSTWAPSFSAETLPCETTYGLSLPLRARGHVQFGKTQHPFSSLLTRMGFQFHPQHSLSRFWKNHFSHLQSKQEILVPKYTELTLILLLDASPPILCQSCACYAIVIYSKRLLIIKSSFFPSPSTQTCSCSLCGFFETLYTRSSVQN
jgi:hypothetical protein